MCQKCHHDIRVPSRLEDRRNAPEDTTKNRMDYTFSGCFGGSGEAFGRVSYFVCWDVFDVSGVHWSVKIAAIQYLGLRRDSPQHNESKLGPFLLGLSQWKVRFESVITDSLTFAR